MRVRTTAGVAVFALTCGAYVAAQTAVRDPQERKASFACWWSPGQRAATVTWRFGARPPGSDIVSNVTRNAPFGRKSRLSVGETMNVKIKFAPGQPLTGPGLSLRCVFKAGTNVVPFGEGDHSGMDRTVVVT